MWQSLLDAIRQLVEVAAAYYAGNLKGKLEEVHAQEQADLQAAQKAAKASDAYATLSDDELHRVASDRAERLRLRLKARATDASGGKHD